MSAINHPDVSAMESDRRPVGVKRGIQFSVRGMFLLVALFALCMYGVRWAWVRWEARVLSYEGWVIEPGPDGPTMRRGRHVQSPDALPRIIRVAAREGVVALSISGDFGGMLDQLQGLPQLKRLSMGGWKMTRADMEQISRLPALETLDLGDFEPDALHMLAKAPRLESLALCFSPPDSFGALPKILRLRWLALRPCHPAQYREMIKQMKYVAQCANLDVLDMHRPNLTPDDVKVLRDAPKLRMLRLANSDWIGSDVCRAVGEIGSLRTFSSGKARMLGEDALRKSRPDIQILKDIEYLPGDPFKWSNWWP